MLININNNITLLLLILFVGNTYCGNCCTKSSYSGYEKINTPSEESQSDEDWILVKTFENGTSLHENRKNRKSVIVYNSPESSDTDES